MKKFILVMACLIVLGNEMKAQIYEPIKWNYQLSNQDAAVQTLRFTAIIEPGWHLYDMNMPEDGPISTSFTFESKVGVELQGKPHATSKPLVYRSPVFDNMELRQYEKTVTFVQQIKITDRNKFRVNGSIRFMACDEERCIPPEDFSFEFGKEMLIAAGNENKSPQPETTQPIGETVDETVDKTKPIETDSLVVQEDILPVTAETLDIWSPVQDELRAYEQQSDTDHTSWWYIFVGGFVGGILAFFMPCVWPMVPMTVSFFLKRTKSRRKSLLDTLLYASSIIVIYVLLGILVTLAFGASALNDLSTSAGFNLFFFALLVLFAASFLGAFELSLPVSWTNKLDKKADATTGILSIFLMAFTLVLVSFSCTGPIIGTLLVETAVANSLIGPVIGMFGFALALSIPFALFAFFPSWMQQMPKSGGWLNTIKVVLGFLELALALKFLSVADLSYHWGILDREVFLVLWIVIFALLGLYLLGKISLAHDDKVTHTSVPRLLLAIISLTFAIYMIPGLWGAPLKAISAFSPPLYTQDFNLYEGEVLPQFKDYEAGMDYARTVGKPVMIDFTGFGCVNCRNMEAAVWTEPRVKNIIDNDFVLISLYVDDKAELPRTIAVTESGKTRKLKTIGDRWSYLQRHKFGTNAQPYYVLLDNNGRPLAPSRTYNKNITEYLDFLKGGLKQYKKINND